MKKTTKFVCQVCGYQSPKWAGRCPDCGEWASLVEEFVTETKTASKKGSAGVLTPPKPITEISAEGAARTATGIGEFDRVLGGGVVDGSLVLVGGDPGIGKSTILIQAACNLSLGSDNVLYVSGEESAEQIKLRANRLALSSEKLLIAAETDINAIAAHAESVKPKFLFIDSIQTMFDSELSSAPGTVSQVRACTAALMNIAKNGGISVFIVGHVTKEGTLAGPRNLEHMVDTVLYFEGDRHMSYRVLRAVKNRFGSTDEVGIFEMTEKGLECVANPSEALLSERPEHGIGSVVVPIIEGSRAILVEIQALVSRAYANPKITVSGVDYAGVQMVLAVLEKRVRLPLGNKDVYVNVTGGFRVTEPAADLAIAMAVTSALLDMPFDQNLIAMGEIGLPGEIRSVSQAQKRLKEAHRMGFEKAVVTKKSVPKLRESTQMKLMGASTLAEAVAAAFPRVEH